MPATSLKQVETETAKDWEVCGTLQTHPLHLEHSTGSPLTGDGVMIRHERCMLKKAHKQG